MPVCVALIVCIYFFMNSGVAKFDAVTNEFVNEGYCAVRTEHGYEVLLDEETLK